MMIDSKTLSLIKHKYGEKLNESDSGPEEALNAVLADIKSMSSTDIDLETAQIALEEDRTATTERTIDYQELRPTVVWTLMAMTRQELEPDHRLRDIRGLNSEEMMTEYAQLKLQGDL